MQEPITIETDDRFTLFPIKYPDLWSLAKKHESALWIADEIDYKTDLDSWDTLTDDEKYFIKNILAFFAGADGIVMENINSNFAQEICIPEARSFYSIQNYIENVHSETYSRLIDNFIKDPQEKDKLFGAIKHIPCVTKKAKWAMKWMNNDPKNPRPLAERLLAFAVVEGVFFSGSFCAIFWLKSRHKMVNALGTSNEFIARDEALHCNFAIQLYKYIVNKLSPQKAHEIFREAVEIEQEFIIESIPCKLVGMNSDLMIQYIKYVANFWLTKFEYPILYPGVDNPFPFMVLNDLDGKTNFFEKRVSEYSKGTGLPKNLELNDDF